MPHRDVIAIGASLGGWDALPRLIADLPANLEAAVLVVMHIAVNGADGLAQKLNTASSLRAAPARDGELLQAGRIYVAIADHHLMVESGRIRVTRGPRESHARPSIDVLFRSVAYNHGSSAIGVLLTGRLDDGTAGLWAIKDRGGTVIVQDPGEAAYPSMPRNALEYVEADFILPLKDIPAILHSLTQESQQQLEPVMPNERLEIENQIAMDESAFELGFRSLGNPSLQTCPECHGSMVEIHDGRFTRFRCHTGHGFTALALDDRLRVAIETSLWSALALIEQYEMLLMNRPATSAADADKTKEIRALAQRVRDLARDPALRAEDG
jgi:two-component system, chemotaxis family, protein-glutamate methylesterase/glutaminase